MGGPLAGPRPDPGPGGRAKPKPKLLQKGGARVTVEDVTPKPKKSARLKMLERTGDTLRAAIAIKKGKAEAHPRMAKPGAFGELDMSPKERGSIERTFRESLERSAPRRGKKAQPRKPTGVPRGNLMASKRKPARRSSRMSGSGR